jgi:CelD/BcsL family acetyltransferase involved in cellulose biosynthesis
VTLRLAVARSVAEVPALREAWERLCAQSLAQSAPVSVFQSFAWNLLAAQIFQQQVPHVILATSDHASVLLPAAVHEGWCATLLGEAMSDYPDFIAYGDRGDVEELLAAAWQELAQLGLPLGFQSVRAGEHFDLWRPLGPQAFVKAPCADPAEISAEAFAARHPKLSDRFRSLLRRGARLIMLEPAREGDLLRDIYFAKAQQFALSGNNLFADRRRVEFMVQACAHPHLGCEMFALECGGDLLAVLVTFRDARARRIYTIWFDQRWARFSPGMLLLYEVMRQSLEQGLIADLLTGDQPHKSRLATSAVQLYRIETDAKALAGAAQRFERLPVAA